MMSLILTSVLGSMNMFYSNPREYDQLSSIFGGLGALLRRWPSREYLNDSVKTNVDVITGPLKSACSYG